ncbi:group-specific protein [Paenibacillus xylanexedens]|uniref:group-specific protein n=1 Tax=Paenibacillus xylanexedens TaxID=528191 RepID=UPI000FBDCA09|nr:hypothetical protein EDO6_00461 [Paenibacillus xylanexedens]
MIVNVQVDQDEIRRIYKASIEAAIKDVDKEDVFWDTPELKRRTNMSWDTIQKTFFFDPNFPKKKVGTKWFYPVRKTRKYLEEWLENLPTT